MRFFLFVLILSSVSFAHAQDIDNNEPFKKTAHPVFLNFEEGDDNSLIGDIKVDLFQILLGRFGGGVELYGQNSMRGLYLSANYYSHFFTNILNARGSNEAPTMESFPDSSGSMIPYYDNVTSSNLFRSWNVAIEYRIYKKASKKKADWFFGLPTFDSNKRLWTILPAEIYGLTVTRILPSSKHLLMRTHIVTRVLKALRPSPLESPSEEKNSSTVGSLLNGISAVDSMCRSPGSKNI